MESHLVYYILTIVIFILIGGSLLSLSIENILLKRRRGHPVQESSLNKEIYRIISSVPHEGKIYYLLLGGSGVINCWVTIEEGFKNFTIEGDNLLLPKQ